jgi:hypothetical protein
LDIPRIEFAAGSLLRGAQSLGFAMHFGLYLKKKGVISAEQLVAAAEIQLSSLTRIGQLALEESILSPRDIFDVLRAQGELPNQRFGDIAIEMGLMTRDDLMRLLMIQTDRRRPIGEILVSQGVLTRVQLSQEMGEYRHSISKRRTGSAVPSKIVPMVRRLKIAPTTIN